MTEKRTEKKMTEMKSKRDNVRRESRPERELKGREDRERESERGRKTKY